MLKDNNNLSLLWTPYVLKSKVYDCECGRRYIKTKESPHECLFCFREKLGREVREINYNA